MKRKEQIICVINAIVFLIAAYGSILLFSLLMTYASSPLALMIFAIPSFLGIYNAIYLGRYRSAISRETLLGCSVLIKYGLIPLYIIGGLLICVLILLTFTPIVFMIFVTPVAVTMLSLYGYVTMLAGGVFSFAYLKKAKDDKIHSKWLISLAALFQFFFTMDVISVGALALKEKKYVKVTIGVTAILALSAIGTFTWMVFNMVSAM